LKSRTQTIIIASGASHRHLGLESEKLLETKGVTYCATCDGALPIFRDQPLVVVGGGDQRGEEATYLTRFSPRFNLVHRATPCVHPKSWLTGPFPIRKSNRFGIQS